MTVAIPTFNRAALLRRALDSVLSQDYEHLEVLIGDNASEDDTHLLRYEVRSDRRVRWLRHETNLGALGNFETLLGEATGHYFMWLADDDFLSPGYISHCVKRLAEPDAPRNVVGRAEFRRDGRILREESFRYIDDDPRQRVLSYYRSVVGNSLFYSMSTTTDAREVLPFFPGVSCDWVHVARHLALGRAEYLDDAILTVGLHGDEDTAKSDFPIEPGWQRYAYKMIYMAHDVARDICTHPVYAGLRPGQRRDLAFRCASATFIRRCSRGDVFFAAVMTMKRYLPAGPYAWLKDTWRQRSGSVQSP